ncbi:MAG: hypothetical protein WBB45_14800 [Cyclobacteriaceae bacterium]
MKKLNLSDLSISSFTTSEKRVVLGGAEAGPTEHKTHCPDTEALRDTDYDVTA